MLSRRIANLLFGSMRYMIATLALICAAAAVAQENDFEAPPTSREMTVAELSESVSRELESLRTFESYPMPGSFERQRTFDVRRDQKTIHVLGRILSLAERVLGLPKDAPARETLDRLMRARGDLIEQTLVDRFASLTTRLNES